MSDEVEAWRGVAAGWERRRPTFWDATRVVAERLVDLLDPQPGDRLLELAAGPGDTGFLALERVRPGGRLLSTDAAAEMVEAARRHAAEIGLDDVDFAVEDITALSLADASFDGVLCRWGVMLVDDMEAAVAETARVLRPGAAVALAVWADADENPWMSAAGRSAVALGLAERRDPDAPGPFRLAGPGRLEALLGTALDVETVEDVPLTWRAASADESWAMLNDLSPGLTELAARLRPDELGAVRAGVEATFAPYVGPDGSLAVPALARVARARAR